MNPEILTTKLLVPRLCTHFISRPRLMRQINLGLERMLSLISAPAGFGKTLLLAEWAAQDPHLVSWVSLDLSENHPSTFWMYVIAALESSAPGLCKSIRALFEGAVEPPVQTILITLINEITRLPFTPILVLDNYHVIDNPDVHNQIAFVLENQPANLRLIIASRTDPPLALPRLRTRNQVSEIRIDQLRFTYEETQSLFVVAHGFQLANAQLLALHAATEGWIGGLQMIAIWLHRLLPAQYHSVLAEFALNNRYIVEYLLAEIFQQQPDVRQRFLLYSSILDTLTGPLARAVTGEAHAQELLEELEEENLFISALDPRRDRYRYHAMFHDFLKHRLAQTQPEQIPALHQRASLWYEQQGLLNDAVQHAFAGRDWERALRLTELAAELMTLHERFVGVQKYLEQHQLQKGLENQWLATELVTNPMVQRDMSALALGRIYLELGHANEAVKVLLGINLAEPAFNNAQAKFSLITALIEARLQQGRLHLAAATYQSFGNLVLTQPCDLTWFKFYQALCSLYYEWNQLEKAAELLTPCFARLTQKEGAEPWLGYCLFWQARIDAARGDEEEATEARRQATALAAKIDNPGLQAHLQAYQVRLWLAQGNWDAVRQWSDSCGLQLDEPVAFRSHFNHLTLVRVLIAQGQAKRTVPFLDQLLLVAEATGRTRDVIESLMLRALAYHALEDAKQAFADFANALCLAESEGYVRLFLDEGQSLLPLLQVAATRGVTHIYVQNLLAAFPSRALSVLPVRRQEADRPVALSPLVEQLTEREREVLRHVAAGKPNREIAELLHVSPTTVKKHLGNILGKLAVKNRTQAAARARELQIV